MEKWICVITWEIKETGKVRELSTLDRAEYEDFLEYLKEHEHLFKIIGNYALEVK